MKKFASLAGIAALGSLAAAGASAAGYNKIATITVDFGGNANNDRTNVTGTTSDGGSGTQLLPYSNTSDVGWTSNGTNALAALTNSTFFTSLGGYNSLSYSNSDYASASGCAAIVAGLQSVDPDPVNNTPYTQGATRKYECRYSLADGTPTAIVTPVTGEGPVARAVGTVTVTDTTLTGTLTIVNTSDVPTGATTSIITTVTPNVRTSSSVGNGFAGYNYRSADGSPFGNSWYGISTQGTYTLNLTGTFNDTTWTIDGGSATFNDAGFACAQGGLGGGSAGTLCTPSATGGGFQPNGANLSWGMDPDGTGTAVLTALPIVVKDAPGPSGNIIVTLAGILANLSVDVGGNITTNQAEFRRALGSAAGNCSDHIAYDGSKISCGTLTSGVVTITGTAVDPDTTPDAYSFAAVTNAALSTVVTSDTVTITGINQAATISISAGGEYSIGCNGTFVSTAGTINNNDTVCVRQTSSASQGTLTTVTLTVGGVPAPFDVTTSSSDTTPDAFTFTSVTNAAISTLYTSNSQVIAGIDAPAPISITGGAYSIDGGAYTSASGTITVGQSVTVQQTSSALFSTTTNTVLTIGGVDGTFSVTTLASDVDPNPFTFNPATNQALAAPVVSNTVTIGGINTAAPISVTGGEYSIGCTSTFVSSAGSINDGETVCVKGVSSATPGTTTTVTLSVGGTNGVFSITTQAPDTTPNAFSFTTQNNVPVATIIDSNEVTITGFNTATTISVTGGEYSLDCNGTWTTANGTLTPGQSVCVRQESSPDPGVTTTAVLTVGGVNGNFKVTTEGGDKLPGGNSAMDEFAIGLLGLAAWLRRRRQA